MSPSRMVIETRVRENIWKPFDILDEYIWKFSRNIFYGDIFLSIMNVDEVGIDLDSNSKSEFGKNLDFEFLLCF